MLVSWFVLVGGVLIAMAFASHFVQRMPLSPAIVYLATGALVGPLGVHLLQVDLRQHVRLLELLTEVAVLIALFAVGLRLRLPLRWSAWRTPLRLATTAMVFTVAGAAALAVWLLDMPWGAAVLLAAILAPTDPVLASDVQIHEPGDRDAVRLSLTAEGGLNDGTAFPAVMLALGLLGLRPMGSLAWEWIAFDLVWAVGAGLGLGWLCGVGVGRAVAWLRRSGHPLESEEFLVCGVIALTYGMALLLHAYGFLAVFAAGAGLWHIERRQRRSASVRDRDGDGAPDDAAAPGRLLQFAGQCERLAEVAVVLIIGAALSQIVWHWQLLAFALGLMLLVRPLAVLLALPGTAMSRGQRRLVAWFGIRGVGSLYYLSYAAGYGFDTLWDDTLVSAVLLTVALSIVVHGVSATPLMARYHARRGGRAPRRREGL